MFAIAPARALGATRVSMKRHASSYRCGWVKRSQAGEDQRRPWAPQLIDDLSQWRCERRHVFLLTIRSR
jgi:hypothetical protein